MNPADVHADQPYSDAQERHVGVGPILPDDHSHRATQQDAVVGDHNLLNGQFPCDAHSTRAVEHQTPRPTKVASIPIDDPSAGVLDGSDQSTNGNQCPTVAVPVSSPPAIAAPVPMTHPSGVTSPTPPEPAIRESIPNRSSPVLADPLLALAADVLDDLERVRIANENRLRQLTRDETDKDGQERGFGLTLDHPDVARLAALVDALAKAEHDATLNLQRMVRRHPLGPWIKAARGVGEKQGARLLAAIGDPYIRPELRYPDGRVEPARPRRLTELYAYCGYHVLPISQQRPDFQDRHANGDPISARHASGEIHTVSAGGTQHPTDQCGYDGHKDIVGGNGGNPNHDGFDTHEYAVGVAATRTRGSRINWNPTARMRGRLIAESIMKSGGPYRVIYDEGRAKYANAVHQVECKRCGPAGKPAPVGSTLSDGHKHARALRLVTKRVLRDLWREAKRLHGQGGGGEEIEKSGLST